MKKIYHAPVAALTVFKPTEALALIELDNLLQGRFDEETDRTPAQTTSGDIRIVL